MTARRLLAPIALTGLGLALVAGQVQGSGAAFTSSSSNPGAAIGSGDWTAPQVALENPGSPLRGTVALRASATDAIGSVAAVSIQRRGADGAWTEICAPSAVPSTCSWSTAGLADGSYDLRAVATDDSGNAGTSAVVADRVVANALPAVTVGDPGSPLRGTVTLGATASSLAGITSVRIQRAQAGSSTWTDVCADTTAPYSCALDTATLADGRHDLRAIATDGFDRTSTSAAVANVQVDNAAPSAALADPGSPIGGTVALAATAADAGSGVASVTFQVSPAGAGAWTDIAVRSASPYSTAWDTTTVANGSYDLRVRVADAAGNTATSAVVAGRTVQNVVAPRGLDVQTTNAQTPGRLAAGDTITLTWSRAMAPASLIPGWSGIGGATVYVRLRDNASADVLDFWTTSSATGATGLGTVSLNGDFVTGTVTFGALASLSSPSSVTVVLSSPSGSGTLRTSTADVAMTWLPSASATDTIGVATSTQAVTESGAPDRDF